MKSLWNIINEEDDPSKWGLDTKRKRLLATI